MGITQYGNAHFLLLCIRKEHVDSKVYKYEGIRIRVIFENALVKERKRVGNMKEKKKLSLAAQIFIALVLAVVAGLLMQKYANFAETYIKPFGTIF